MVILSNINKPILKRRHANESKEKFSLGSQINKHMIPKVENPFAWIVVFNAIRMVTGSNIKKPYLIETIYERRNFF